MTTTDYNSTESTAGNGTLESDAGLISSECDNIRHPAGQNYRYTENGEERQDSLPDEDVALYAGIAAVRGGSMIQLFSGLGFQIGSNKLCVRGMALEKSQYMNRRSRQLWLLCRPLSWHVKVPRYGHNMGLRKN